MEEDVIGTSRELGKRDAEICALCGQPVPADALARETITTGTGVDPADTVGVCPRCKQALITGDLPVDLLEGDGDEGQSQ
ncbi:MAG: hypothetical protein AB7G88_03870 [Thermomicrobiales bacterium]